MALTRFDLPDLGEGLTEAEVVAWHVSPGDRVVADQPLVSLETDKAVVEIPAPWAGTVVRLLARVGEVVAVGAPLVEIDTAARPDPGAIVGDLGAPDPRAAAGAAAQTAGAAPAPDAGAGAPGPSGAAPRAMPAARALARARGIDLSGVTGTGPGGVITRADVAAAAEGGGGKGWAPLSGARRSMARRMAAAAAVPRATLHDLADIGAWMAPGADVLVRLIRACVAGARAAPQLNAWYDPQAMAVMRHDRVDLGIAVDTGGALLVPVLRDAGGRDAAGLRAEADRLIAAARGPGLAPADLADPTLTLSSYGPLGGRHAELVVMPPTVAILGAGRAAPGWRPGGEGMLLPLSLSFDHRAVTGGEAARFLAAVIADLESGN